MSNHRLEQLQIFLKEDPNDPFTIYAIANEYKSMEQFQEALPYYEELLNNHSNYTGTYYHLAEVYTEIGEREKAESTYQKGLEICRQENDLHALRELQNAYNNFLFDDDE